MSETSRLQEFETKYKEIHPGPTLDRRPRVSFTNRLGKNPSAERGDISLASNAKDIAKTQMDLAMLAEQYGQLGLKFSDLVGEKSYLGTMDVLKIGAYNLIMQPRRAAEVKINAIGRHYDTLEHLVDKMGDIMRERLAKAQEMQAKVQTEQRENVGRLMRLERKGINGLRESFKGQADYAKYEKAIAEYEADLGEVQTELNSLEPQVHAAREKGDLETVIKITDTMSRLLDIKQGIMEGKLTKEGEYSDARREVLNHTVAIKSAKENMAVSRNHYLQLGFLLDSYTEQVITYTHALEDSLESWKATARIAAYNLELNDNVEFLDKLRVAGQNLLRITSDMSQKTAEATFRLMQTEMFDIDATDSMTEKLRLGYTDLLERKNAWAQNVQTFNESVNDPYLRQYK
jgi:hypothetical protein